MTTNSNNKDPRESYAYLQNQFRKQAQRQINLTKRRLDSNCSDSYANQALEVHKRTIAYLQQIGVVGPNGKRIVGKEVKLVNDLRNSRCSHFPQPWLPGVPLDSRQPFFRLPRGLLRFAPDASMALGLHVVPLPRGIGTMGILAPAGVPDSP